MVEKITVNPEKIRAYGNVMMSKSASDYDTYKSTVTKTTDTVYGATQNVMTLTPKQYNVSFKSASYTTSTDSVAVKVTVLDGSTPVTSGTVYVTGCGGSGSGNISYDGEYAASVIVTGISESGTLTANYHGSTATASLTYDVQNYTLTFSQPTYAAGPVSVTLKNNGVAVSGETVTFTWEDLGIPDSVTATTNSNGVATTSIYPLNNVTVTASYQGVTATCTVLGDII